MFGSLGYEHWNHPSDSVWLFNPNLSSILQASHGKGINLAKGRFSLLFFCNNPPVAIDEYIKVRIDLSNSLCFCCFLLAVFVGCWLFFGLFRIFGCTRFYQWFLLLDFFGRLGFGVPVFVGENRGWTQIPVQVPRIGQLDSNMWFGNPWVFPMFSGILWDFFLELFFFGWEPISLGILMGVVWE